MVVVSGASVVDSTTPPAEVTSSSSNNSHHVGIRFDLTEQESGYFALYMEEESTGNYTFQVKLISEIDFCETISSPTATVDNVATKLLAIIRGKRIGKLTLRLRATLGWNQDQWHQFCKLALPAMDTLIFVWLECWCTPLECLHQRAAWFLQYLPKPDQMEDLSITFGDNHDIKKGKRVGGEGGGDLSLMYQQLARYVNLQSLEIRNSCDGDTIASVVASGGGTNNDKRRKNDPVVGLGLLATLESCQLLARALDRLSRLRDFTFYEGNVGRMIQQRKACQEILLPAISRKQHLMDCSFRVGMNGAEKEIFGLGTMESVKIYPLLNQAIEHLGIGNMQQLIKRQDYDEAQQQRQLEGTPLSDEFWRLKKDQVSDNDSSTSNKKDDDDNGQNDSTTTPPLSDESWLKALDSINTTDNLTLVFTFLVSFPVKLQKLAPSLPLLAEQPQQLQQQQQQQQQQQRVVVDHHHNQKKNKKETLAAIPTTTPSNNLDNDDNDNNNNNNNNNNSNNDDGKARLEEQIRKSIMSGTPEGNQLIAALVNVVWSSSSTSISSSNNHNNNNNTHYGSRNGNHGNNHHQQNDMSNGQVNIPNGGTPIRVESVSSTSTTTTATATATITETTTTPPSPSPPPPPPQPPTNVVQNRGSMILSKVDDLIDLIEDTSIQGGLGRPTDQDLEATLIMLIQDGVRQRRSNNNNNDRLGHQQ